MVGWEVYLDVQALISILVTSKAPQLKYSKQARSVMCRYFVHEAAELIRTKEIAGAVKDSLQVALIELVRQGRDVDKAWNILVSFFLQVSSKWQTTIFQLKYCESGTTCILFFAGCSLQPRNASLRSDES